DDPGKRNMKANSFSGGLTFSPYQTLHFFANVSTSFETPTTSELANQESGAGGFNPDLGPQKSLSFEGGLRGSTISSRINYSFSAYRTRIRDILVPFEIPSAPGRQYYRTAATASHKGMEVSV